MKQKLHNLRDHLCSAVRGQEMVIPRIVSVIQRGELGLSKQSRPKGSFLFLGPTGVGKTEMALQFSDYLFGPGSLARFDMSEFQTQESLGVLLGGKLGERGTLGLALDKLKAGTLLFDEIEKAHPRVMDIFLQMLDAARITLADGSTLDLSGFYIVFTSNIASVELLDLRYSSYATMERHVLMQAQQKLRPELFARITEKLVFNRLDYEVQLEIANLHLDRELQFLADRGRSLARCPQVLEFLVLKGFHPRLGARPMRDAVEKYVGDAVAFDLLAGANGCGRLVVDHCQERLTIHR
jgi:ATP-dependent Clp protease ATP-binding subunit ClpB